MKQFVIAALAATTALTGVMSAGVAAAQPNHYDRDRHDDRGHDNRGYDNRGYDHRGDHRDNRGGDRDHRDWDRGHSNWNRYYSQDRWQGNHRYYGGRYGYNGYHGRWRTGERYPYWRDNRYVINDYRYYRLPPPRAGYRYYRDDNGDIVMAAIASGAIGLIIGSALNN